MIPHKEKMRLKKLSRASRIAHASGFNVVQDGKLHTVMPDERAAHIDSLASHFREQRRKNGIGRKRLGASSADEIITPLEVTVIETSEQLEAVFAEASARSVESAAIRSSEDELDGDNNENN